MSVPLIFTPLRELKASDTVRFSSIVKDPVMYAPVVPNFVLFHILPCSADKTFDTLHETKSLMISLENSVLTQVFHEVASATLLVLM